MDFRRRGSDESVCLLQYSLRSTSLSRAIFSMASDFHLPSSLICLFGNTGGDGCVRCSSSEGVTWKGCGIESYAKSFFNCVCESLFVETTEDSVEEWIRWLRTFSEEWSLGRPCRLRAREELLSQIDYQNNLYERLPASRVKTIFIQPDQRLTEEGWFRVTWFNFSREYLL